MMASAARRAGFGADSAADRDRIIAFVESEFAALMFELGRAPALDQRPEFTLDGRDDGDFSHSLLQVWERWGR